MTATKTSLYRLGNIVIGKPITPLAPPYPAAKITQTEWTLHPGIYTPRQLVQGFAPLLDTVLHHLSPDPNPSSNQDQPRTQLLDNIAAILSTDTRESSLPFPSHVPDASRAEIRDQARRIGQRLVKWATEATDGFFKPDLVLRSRCEGHLLTPPNVDLMFGRRAKPHLMQLYNEYMHQMVLLRDALLPFYNFEDVCIPISGGGNVRGLRFLEGPREGFMAKLFTKQVTQTSVVAMARALLSPGLGKAGTGIETSGYGFQYGAGLVIPAVFVDDARRPLHLLQYVPAHVDPSRAEIVFQYEFGDYYAAPKVEIPVGTVDSSLSAFPEIASPGLKEVSLGLRFSDTPSDPAGQLDLRLAFNDGELATVDVGQIARGHRYSYDPSEPGPVDTPGIVHAAHDVLLQPGTGLVTAEEGGFHVISADDRILALAVLGKLYPENVVRLSRKDGLERAVNAGKGFEPKFVVWA
ncbi:hypothetical protein BJY01DRAFT_259501 [Aspergillus pseudoustus]|uniref:Uncharacterized protein n=1 Tax=Aspergillus pseudoustus TaxID=1810923 RepID=A0ABR4J6D5_9EURO